MDETTGFAHQTVQQFLEGLAAKTPTPGGGAAAPISGAIGAALANMVVSYSLGKKNLADHQPALERAASELTDAANKFQILAKDDAIAYARLNELQRLPEGDSRKSEIGAATSAAIDVPVKVVELCAQTLDLCARLAPISNKYLLSDLAIAAILLESCARASRWNVLINAGDDASALVRVDEALGRAATLRDRVEKACLPG